MLQLLFTRSTSFILHQSSNLVCKLIDAREELKESVAVVQSQVETTRYKLGSYDLVRRSITADRLKMIANDTTTASQEYVEVVRQYNPQLIASTMGAAAFAKDGYLAPDSHAVPA